MSFILAPNQKQYAEQLREWAQMLEDSQQPLQGVQIQIFLSDGRITALGRMEKGFNPLAVCGLFYAKAMEFAQVAIATKES